MTKNWWGLLSNGVYCIMQCPTNGRYIGKQPNNLIISLPNIPAAWVAPQAGVLELERLNYLSVLLLPATKPPCTLVYRNIDQHCPITTKDEEEGLKAFPVSKGFTVWLWRPTHINCPLSYSWTMSDRLESGNTCVALSVCSERFQRKENPVNGSTPERPKNIVNSMVVLYEGDWLQNSACMCVSIFGGRRFCCDYFHKVVPDLLKFSTVMVDYI